MLDAFRRLALALSRTAAWDDSPTWSTDGRARAQPAECLSRQRRSPDENHLSIASTGGEPVFDLSGQLRIVSPPLWRL